jgi:UDPglucose 6-dehydrogenase
VSNPEFLREGAAIDDFKRPDRIVLGLEDARARAVMSELYRPMLLNEAQMVFTDRRTSELIKYAANAFLAMKITFINEVADLCERVGADVGDLARGIGLDARIGSRFLHPGPGYGGSCFPKDTLALIRTAADAGSPVRLIETVVSVNDARKPRMAEKILAACGGSVAGKRIAVLGLTFKSDTDDMRDAPSLVIVPALAAAGADLVAYDPQGMEAARAALPDLALAPDPYAAVAGADALVILTEWDAFRALDLARVRGLMRAPVIVDLRNLYAADEMARAGFCYVSLGRGSSVHTGGVIPPSA